MPDREKVISHIEAEIGIAKLCKKDFASVDIDMLSDAYELLKEQPQIVRCKDCKAWKQYDGCPNLGGCELYPEYNKMGDWFCNFGERKEGR